MPPRYSSPGFGGAPERGAEDVPRSRQSEELLGDRPSLATPSLDRDPHLVAGAVWMMQHRPSGRRKRSPLLAAIARARNVDEGGEVAADDLSSRLASFTSVTSQVTTEPFLRSSALSMDRLELLDAERNSPSRRRRRAPWPDLVALLVLLDARSSAVSNRGRRDALFRRCRRRPRRARTRSLFSTSPSISVPGGYFRRRPPWIAHGLLEADEMRRLTGSTSRICTSTSCEGNDLAGTYVLLGPRHLETWMRPSMPGSSSTKAPCP
jgi:hypothetical protein